MTNHAQSDEEGDEETTRPVEQTNAAEHAAVRKAARERGTQPALRTRTQRNERTRTVRLSQAEERCCAALYKVLIADMSAASSVGCGRTMPDGEITASQSF